MRKSLSHSSKLSLSRWALEISSAVRDATESGENLVMGPSMPALLMRMWSFPASDLNVEAIWLGLLWMRRHPEHC